MKLYNKNYEFLLTVGAVSKVSELCPQGDLSKITEILDGPYANVLEVIAQLAEAMTAGYIQNADLFYGTHKDYEVLTSEMVKALPAPLFKGVKEAVVKAFADGVASNIDAEQAENTKKK